MRNLNLDIIEITVITEKRIEVLTIPRITVSYTVFVFFSMQLHKKMTKKQIEIRNIGVLQCEKNLNIRFCRVGVGNPHTYSPHPAAESILGSVL